VIGVAVTFEALIVLARRKKPMTASSFFIAGPFCARLVALVKKEAGRLVLVLSGPRCQGDRRAYRVCYSCSSYRRATSLDGGLGAGRASPEH